MKEPIESLNYPKADSGTHPLRAQRPQVKAWSWGPWRLLTCLPGSCVQRNQSSEPRPERALGSLAWSPAPQTPLREQSKRQQGRSSWEPVFSLPRKGFGVGGPGWGVRVQAGLCPGDPDTGDLSHQP